MFGESFKYSSAPCISQGPRSFEARLLESCVGGVAGAMALASSCFRNVGWLLWGVVLISFLSYVPALESISREQFFVAPGDFLRVLGGALESRAQSLGGPLGFFGRSWSVPGRSCGSPARSKDRL